MKIIACITVAAFLLTGCTTLRPVQSSPQTLQEDITSRGLIEAGDRVQITTTDGRQYQFKVVSIGDGHIKGEGVDVRIKDVAQVSKREVSAGKTALLAGGSLLAAIGVAALIAILTFAKALGGT
jgi:hypothetical protein